MANKNFSVEMSDESLKKLEVLKQDCQLRTDKELINNALTLFQWAVKEVKAGNIIASINKDLVSREVILPALQNISSRE